MITEQQQVMPNVNYSSILIIKDPLNQMNNIGKSTFNFDTIRQEFAAAHDKLTDALREFLEADDNNVEGEEKSDEVATT